MNASLSVLRNPMCVVATGRDRIIFSGPRGENLSCRTGQPARWSELLQCLAQPTSFGSLRDAGTIPDDLDADLFDRLVEEQYLFASGDPETLDLKRRDVFINSPAFHLASRPKACGHLLVGCTGSVVAGLLPQTLLSISYSGFQHQLDVILTETACRFLSRDLLEAYGIRTWTDGFEQRDDVRVPHVKLAQSADIIVVLPATADALQRVATGACSDLLSLCIAASAAPAVMVPAMNETMWNDPAIQRNVCRIREDGRYVVEPTFIFGAADFARDAAPMYGGHGTLWAGAGALMDTAETILALTKTPTP